ncbi:MAG: hypothetical protein C0189_02475 [Caldisericum exile]|uniref:Uncharacterized protein n=1 Tax=Caldisericum exile TaxID=693075 RepID=A0A2J6WEU2_9BACT|nr:MAG: hypothetical protein C0189_02475 [Caldisericum exile]
MKEEVIIAIIKDFVIKKKNMIKKEKNLADIEKGRLYAYEEIIEFLNHYEQNIKKAQQQEV